MKNIIILTLCILAIIVIEVGIIHSFHLRSIERYDRCDSLITLYTRLLKADSLKMIHLNRSFYIDKDSVNIDKNGYFVAKYYKQFKIQKD